MIKSSRNLAVRMSIKQPIGSRRKNFRQSWTMFDELVRNNFTDAKHKACRHTSCGLNKM